MELNPQHPVTQAMHDHWHKIVGVLVHKLGQGHIVITLDDLRAMPANVGITCQELTDGIHLRLVDEATAHRLARKEGGLPS